jgi:hypothetical protein
VTAASAKMYEGLDLRYKLNVVDETLAFDQLVIWVENFIEELRGCAVKIFVDQ